MCYQRDMKIAFGWLLVLGLLGACGGGSKSSETVTPATPEPGISAEAYGATCSDAAPCAAGLACTTYYGIAGPAGPSFQSCELACGPEKAACPTNTDCVTISDGPGSVCRPKN